jgi:hypothetical protein
VDCPGDGGNGRMGWNVRRNEASAFRCLTVKDIFDLLYNTVEEIREYHSIEDEEDVRAFEVL